LALVESLLGALSSIVNVAGRLIRQGPKVRARYDVHDRVLMAWAGGPTILSYDSVIYIHNSGVGRFTVREVVLGANDGSLLSAHPDTPRVLEPGDKEQEYTFSSCKVTDFADSHGGISHVYVALAGEPQPRRLKIPAGWMMQVRASCSRDTKDPTRRRR
jgi:hypothetical protein